MSDLNQPRRTKTCNDDIGSINNTEYLMTTQGCISIMIYIILAQPILIVFHSYVLFKSLGMIIPSAAINMTICTAIIFGFKLSSISHHNKSSTDLTKLHTYFIGECLISLIFLFYAYIIGQIING